jgi:integrase
MGKLTAKQVASLHEPGDYGDGDGLALSVKHGRRYWTFRFTLDGRTRTMTFGSADRVSLTEARDRAAMARGKVKAGIDPLAEKAQAKTERIAAAQKTVSFADAATAYIDAHRSAWRGRGEAHWRNSLTQHVLPVFGRKAVGDVSVDDVLRALSPIWTTKTVMATVVRSRIELVLDYARARGWRPGPSGNPAMCRGNLRSLLPPPAKVHRIEHHAALAWREAPGLFQRLPPDGSMAHRCLAFLVLTGTRSGEARGCRWSEIDTEERTWTIPSSRMKAAREHRVPLSPPAMAIIDALAALRTCDLVFFGRHGRMMDDRTLTTVLRRLGHDGITVHGTVSTKPGQLQFEELVTPARDR